jgi:hypothetical protein
MNKKQLTLIALMVGAAINLSVAQSFFPPLKKFSPAEKQRIEKIFAATLSSEHNGLIESCLANVTKMKLDLPEDEFPMIKNEIDNLLANGTTPVVRYEAYLAGAVFANPAMYKGETALQSENPQVFFSMLAERMTKTLLSSL